MAKTSQLFNLYKDRLGRCQSSEELIQISKDIAAADLKQQEKVALSFSCLFIAKHFDRKAKKEARNADS